MWIGDFAEGPYVEEHGEVVPTHLSVFIDVHSRYVVIGRYYLRQNLPVLEDSLLRAFLIHGAPLEIYLDNAKVYHARAYKLMCAEIGIRPLYRPVRDPATGGLVERFILTAQKQFESEVRAQKLMSLDKLNTSFSAWLEVMYHDRVHSEINQTPRDRLVADKVGQRSVDIARVSEFFMRSENRTVDSVYSDISIDAQYYRVSPKLRGDRIEARLDPFSETGRVLLYDLKGKALGEGTAWDRSDDRSTETGPNAKNKTPSDALGDLRRAHRQRLNKQTEGIDYRKVTTPRPYPFNDFINRLCKGADVAGGLSGLDAGTLETLRKFWGAHAALNATHLDLAIERAQSHDLGDILFQLQKIFKET